MSNSKQSTFALTVDIEGEWFQHPGEQGVFDVDRIIYAVKKLENVLDLANIEIPEVAYIWFSITISQGSIILSNLIRLQS